MGPIVFHSNPYPQRRTKTDDPAQPRILSRKLQEFHSGTLGGLRIARMRIRETGKVGDLEALRHRQGPGNDQVPCPGPDDRATENFSGRRHNRLDVAVLHAAPRWPVRCREKDDRRTRIVEVRSRAWRSVSPIAASSGSEWTIRGTSSGSKRTGSPRTALRKATLACCVAACEKPSPWSNSPLAWPTA